MSDDVTMRLKGKSLWFSLIIVRQEQKAFTDAADLLTVVFSLIGLQFIVAGKREEITFF